MDIDLELTSQQIIDKEFTGIKPGYNPLDVDEFLDIVAKDYVLMEKYIEVTAAEIEELRTTVRIYKKKLDELELQNEINQKKFGRISYDCDVSYSNLELLQRINALESALHKAGVDPTTIK